MTKRIEELRAKLKIASDGMFMWQNAALSLQKKLNLIRTSLELIDMNFSKVTRCTDNRCEGCFLDAKMAAEEAAKALSIIEDKK